MELDSKKLMLEQPNDRKRKLSQSSPSTEFSFIYTEASDSNPVLVAPSGRYAIQRSNFGSSLFLFDLYFKQRITFRNPCNGWYWCVALFDDFRIVLRTETQLLCYLLDVAAADRKPIKLNRSPKFQNIRNALSLDSTGTGFLTQHWSEVQLHQLDRPFGRVRSKWTSNPIESAYSVFAARLYDAGTRLWLCTYFGFYTTEVNSLKLQPIKDSAQILDRLIDYWLEPMPRGLAFFDDRLLIAVAKAQPQTLAMALRNDPNTPIKLYALRLSEANGVELMAERPFVSPGKLLCGGAEIHQITVKIDTTPPPPTRRYFFTNYIRMERQLREQSEGTIVHMEFHRPQPLLLIAHKAAMQSGRKFELPPVLPIRPLVGEIPYKA